MTGISTRSKWLRCVSALGVLVIISYVVCLPNVYENEPTDALWFGIDGVLRNVYYVSMILTAIAFVGTVWWLYAYFPRHHFEQLQRPYATFLVGAILWSVTLWSWGRSLSVLPPYKQCLTRIAKLLVIMSLCATSLGSVWIAYRTNQYANRVPIWVNVALFVVCTHVIVLDNIGWTSVFLMRRS